MCRRVNHYKVKSVVHGIAHITGGGLHENLARVLPATVDAEIARDSWPQQPVFSWAECKNEMHRVFNMGGVEDDESSTSSQGT